MRLTHDELFSSDIRDILENEFSSSIAEEVKNYNPDEKSQLAEFELWREWCIQEKDYFLNWGWPTLSYALQGAFGGTSILIAGQPNHGKSQLQTSIVLEVLKNNEDVIVVDFTLDDPKHNRLAQYVANLAHMEINNISFINKINDIEKRKKYEIGCNKVREWIGTNKLFLYENFSDDTNQANVSFIHEKVSSIREKYPDKKIILMIDALNDIDPPQKMSSELEESKMITKLLNKTITSNNVLLITSSHLRKTGGKRATLDDVKGNNHLAYTAKVVIGVYNDMKANKEKAKVVWQDKIGNELVKMPVIEAHFLKSKVSGFNGCIPFLQYNEMGKAVEPAKEVQAMLNDVVYKGV